MAHNILKKFYPTGKLLDDMIFRLETNLGRTHTVSPFTQVYSKYQFSTTSAASGAPPSEEAKLTAPAKEPVKEQAPASK